MNLFKYFSQERLAHAYILIGSSDDELKEVALQTAQWVNCLAEDKVKRPCTTCPNCIKLKNGVHRDCFWIEPQGASQTIQIEQIRGVQRDIAGMPTEGSMKVVIIGAAHRMNEQSQNCLLKTLEEPPNNTLLLLLTQNLVGLLPTVQSRCQLLSIEGEKELPPLTDFELAADVLGEILILGYEGVFNKAAFLEKSRKKNLTSFFMALEILLRDGLIKSLAKPDYDLDKLRQAPIDIELRGRPQDLQKALEAVWYSSFLRERNVNILLLLENLFLQLNKLNIQVDGYRQEVNILD